MALIAFVIGMACARSAEVTVFAAASLTDSLRLISENYESQNSDKILLNFAASSLLARQIEEGAPADIFFSADEAKMDTLDKEDLIMKESRVSRLSNSLVIVVERNSDILIKAPSDLAAPKIKRIALADPKSVPAGIYSKEFLESKKLWPQVQARVIPTENVRGALAAVESGNVEAAMVYGTDASIARRVRIAYKVPLKDGPKISYPMALVTGSKQIDAARKFLHYLASDEAGKIFERFGFIVLK